MTRQIARAESWQRVYEAFQDINFSGFDFYTIKAGMIDYLKLHFPESFNDYIESSELLAIIEMFAYVCEILAYRQDMNAHENILSLAERKKSVLRLAKMLSYTPSRNIPSRGLVKLVSISTTEAVYDSQGNNLANKRIVWNDASNNNWKEQYLLVLNKILQQPFGTVSPTDRVQVEDMLFELYKLDNVPIANGVQTYTVKANGKSLPMELVPITLTENGPIERRPERTNTFSIVYATDGIGDSSDFTGFFIYTKQGILQRISSTFDGITPNQVFNINTSNINDTDVWINNIDPNTGETLKDRIEDLLGHDMGYIGEWEAVDTSNSRNILFNNNKKRNKYEVETLDDDKINVIFGDGEFADIPNGTFDIWFRSSVNEEIVIPKSEIVDKATVFRYKNDANVSHTLTFTFSSVNAFTNNSPSEDIESIRRLASSVYYTQDRMVNGADYNSYMLQDPSILKLKAVNRTFVGDSKYVAWHDPTNSYDNVKLFGDDLRLLYENRVVTNPIPLFTSVDEVVNNYIQDKLGEPGIQLYHVANDIVTNRTVFTSDELSQIKSTIQQAIDSNTGFPVLISYLKATSRGYQGIRFSESVTTATDLDPDDNLKTVNATNVLEWTITVDGTIHNFTTDAGTVGDTFTLVNFQQLIQDELNLIDPIPATVAIINDTLIVQSNSTNAMSAVILNIPFISELSYDPELTSSVSGVNVGTWTAFNTDVEVITPYTFSVSFSNPVWNITNNEINCQCESTSTKFWYTNKNQNIVNEFSYNVERDKIVLLQANADKSGNALLPFKINLDVIGIVNETADANLGLPNINRLLITTLDANQDAIADDPFLYLTLLNKTIFTFTASETPNDELLMDVLEDNEFVAGYSEIEVYRNGVKLFADEYFECDIDGLPVLLGTVTQYVKLYNLTAEDNIEIKKIDYLLYKRETVDQSYSYLKNYKDATLEDKNDWFYNTESLYQRYRGRDNLNFAWFYVTPNYALIDPATTNIHDMFVLTRGYYKQLKQWLEGSGEKPTPPSSYELRSSYAQLLQSKMWSDSVMLHSGQIKILFGAKSIPELQAKIKIVKNPSSRLTDNELKSKVVGYVREFFDINYWEFGESFSFSELSALIHSRLSGDVKSVILVPLYSENNFGDLYEINTKEDEILQADITNADIEVIESLNSRNLKQYPF